MTDETGANRWRKLRRETGLPLLIAAAVGAMSWLDAPNYGPHSAGFTLLLFPLLAAALAAWLAAALWRRRWLRLGALAVALAVCIVCGRQLSREQLCPECDAEYFAAQTEDQIEDESE